MRGFHLDLGSISTRNYLLAVGGVLTLLFAFMGPEGSVDGGLSLRLAQWGLQVAIPLLLLLGIQLLLAHWTAFDRMHAWFKLAVGGLLGGLLFSPFALGLDFLFGVDDWAQIGSPAALFALWLDEVQGVVVPVALVWVAINAPRVLGLDFRHSEAIATRSPATPEPGPPVPQLPATGVLALLPAELGRDVVYIMSELHYLRVVTTRGRTLVLYNLRDAVAQLPRGEGFQPHRSYWVALRHVEGLVRRGGRSELRLSDGSRVPVSRRRLAEVRERLGA